MFSDPFAHNSAVHIPQQSASFAESSCFYPQQSRVVPILANIRILRFDTYLICAIIYENFKALTYLISTIIDFN